MAESLSVNEMSVLDHLLGEFPSYCMVDDFRAVTTLLEREFIEANVRKDGEVDQAVYRITPRGATAYGLSQDVPVLYRVS